MAKITAAELRIGRVIDEASKLWKVLEIGHIRTGKGGGFIVAEVQMLDGSVKKSVRFRSDERLYLAHVEQKQCTFLYKTGSEYFFMPEGECDMVAVDSSLMGEFAVLMMPDAVVTLVYCQGELLQVELPIKLQCKIEQLESAGTSNFQYAITQRIRFKVPNYVNAGEVVTIDSRDGSFLERCKQK